jgi:uncharacterized protein (TIGR03437 family)
VGIQREKPDAGRLDDAVACKAYAHRQSRMRRLDRIAFCALLALLSSARLLAQASEALSFVLSHEIVPAGSTAQIKLSLSIPQPISNGYIHLTFSGTGYPGEPPAVSGASVFSATGDVAAFAIADESGAPYGFGISFYSPSAGVGRVADLPVLEFSIPVAAPFTVALDTAHSTFAGPAGVYSITASSGGAAIGGELSIATVTPFGSTGILPAGSAMQINGTGFSDATSVEIDGASVASFAIESPQLITVMFAAATEITGKHIRLANPDGAQIDYWGGLGTSLLTFPLSASSSGACIHQGPAYEDPVSLALQNPSLGAVPVTVSNVYNSNTMRPGTITANIAAGSSLVLSIIDPANSTFETTSAAGLRAMCPVSASYSLNLDILTWIPIALSLPAPVISWVANAASEAQTAVSPGEILTIFGANIGPAVPSSLAFDSTGNVARMLQGAQVLFDNIPAPLLYASQSQMNAIVPYEISGESVTQIQVLSGTASSVTLGVPVTAAAPGIFAIDSSDQAAVLNEDNSVNGPSNPCARGSIIQIFATGEGITSPPATTGTISGAGLTQTQLPVTISIGGIGATVIYAGSAPDEVSGLLQVNAVVPESVVPGDQVSVIVTVGRANSHPGPTIAVK